MATTDVYIAMRITVPAVCFTLIEIPLFISLLNQLYRGEGQMVQIQFKCSATITFIFSTLFGIIDIVSQIMVWLVPLEFNITLNGVQIYYIYVTRVTLMLLTIYSIYTILLLRLYHTFQESIYQISTRQLYMHVINVSITIITFIMSFYPFTPHKALIKEILVIWVILLTMGYIHLLYTFNRNLFLLVLSQRKSVVMSSKQNTDHDDTKIEPVELNERQINMLSTIRKHTILGSFMVFSNLCFASFLIFFYESVFVNPIASFFFMVIVHIFVITGPLCIYMGFEKNKDFYHKCCNLFDKTCTNICVTLAEKRLNQQTKRITSLTVNGD